MNADPQPQADTPSTGNWLVRLLRDNRLLGVVLPAASVVFAGIASATDSDPLSFWLWIIAGALCAGFAIFKNEWRQRKVSEFSEALTASNDHASSLQGELVTSRDQAQFLAREIHNSVTKSLQRIALHYGLRSTDRLSLYLHSEDGLRIIGRYSDDSDQASIAAENKARVYPLDFGLVGRVARLRKRVKPAISPDPRTDTNGYREWQRTAGFLELPVEAELRMKSRSYDVVPVFDSAEHITVSGVLAVESTKHRCPAVHKLADDIESEGEPIILGLIRESIRLYATTLVDAGEEADDGES